jgi:hypothetical protein
VDIQIEHEVGEDVVIELYDSVGWEAYTRSPDTLAKAIENSSIVVTAHDEHGELIGLARGLSDDATVFYLQDILVRPEHQRQRRWTAAADRLPRALQPRSSEGPADR